MTTYALAHLHNVTMGPQIVAYLEGIDATMVSFGGKFVIHGDGNKRVLEGSFAGDVIMLSFPTRKDAEGWYASEAYRAILPLRTLNSVGDVLLIDGVDDDHKATDILKKEPAPSSTAIGEEEPH